MSSYAATTNFNALSVKDLLEARDLYHVHLMNKENVIATAIGRYRIRKNKSEPRRIDNSQVLDYSWPCVLVFVDKWADEADFGTKSKYHPDQMVPRALYMPDGRVVPVCVIEAPRDENDPGPVANLSFPKNLIGGGYPILCDVQGEEHVATVGCLVTDGHSVYALTNRHVVGEAGEPVYSVVRGTKKLIGKSSPKQITKLLFPEVYDEWPGKNVFVNLDVGLIEVEDKNQWTAQIFGVGTMGRLADLSIDNISLKLIGCPVVGYGAASREMRGEIHALFYRFKSVGGFEYVADFLIGPRQPVNGRGAPPTFKTHPGDSGRLVLLDNANDKAGQMPIAVQWGGHVFVDSSGTSRLPFALATCLSTVLRCLDVDLIRDWNIGHPEYWGAVGHYTIANKACDAIKDKRLKELMNNNLENITFQEPQITKKNLSGLSKHDFVPLADVPDLVWKIGKYNRGQPEHPNHFADMDKPDDKQGGTTLLDLCKDQPHNVSIPVWQRYYDDVGDESRGLLPFRVWQIYDQMVQAVRSRKVAEFVCAAGVLSHYVGDACQPLHISYMFNGDPDDSVRKRVKNRHGQYEMQDVPRAAGVHAAYEDGMVDFHAAEIMERLKNGLANADRPSAVASGHDAAVAVVDLMQKTFDHIKPRDIVNAYLGLMDQTPKPIADALWEQFGDATVDVMADGAVYLAHLWDAAWAAGGGSSKISSTDALDPSSLADLYQNRAFLPSKTIDEIGSLLIKPNGFAFPEAALVSNGDAAKKKPRRSKRKPKSASAVRG